MPSLTQQMEFLCCQFCAKGVPSGHWRLYFLDSAEQYCHFMPVKWNFSKVHPCSLFHIRTCILWVSVNLTVQERRRHSGTASLRSNNTVQFFCQGFLGFFRLLLRGLGQNRCFSISQCTFLNTDGDYRRWHNLLPSNHYSECGQYCQHVFKLLYRLSSWIKKKKDLLNYI